MSIILFEIRSAEAGHLLSKFGLSHKSKNGAYKKGKCSVVKSKDFVKVIYPSGRSYLKVNKSMLEFSADFARALGCGSDVKA